MNTKDSFGIYERGHGGYEETNGFWRRQREWIVKRLKNFTQNTDKFQEMADIIGEAKKNNPNNLPF